MVRLAVGTLSPLGERQPFSLAKLCQVNGHPVSKLKVTPAISLRILFAASGATEAWQLASAAWKEK